MTVPYVGDLKRAAQANELFRQVLFTGDHSQLVVMALQPGEEIGMEIHEVDQILYAVDGKGTVVVDGSHYQFDKGCVVCVPAGAAHNVIDTDDEPLKLFTVYAPAQHPAGTVHRTKADALAAESIPAGV